MRSKEVSPAMSQRKPYTAPRVIRYKCEAEYPDWTRSTVKSLRQQSEPKYARNLLKWLCLPKTPSANH